MGETAARRGRGYRAELVQKLLAVLEHLGHARRLLALGVGDGFERSFFHEAALLHLDLRVLDLACLAVRNLLGHTSLVLVEGRFARGAGTVQALQARWMP